MRAQVNEIKGYTLIEFMVVMTLIGILLALASFAFLPQFRKLEAQRINNELRGFLVNGKQTALIYHTPVTLCVADSNNQCQSNNGEHLLTFIDMDDNHLFDNRVDRLVEIQNLGLHFGKLMTGIALNKNYIKIKPITGNPIGYAGHISYCPFNADTLNTFQVSFSMTGMVKTKPNSETSAECA